MKDQPNIALSDAEKAALDEAEAEGQGIDSAAQVAAKGDEGGEEGTSEEGKAGAEGAAAGKGDGADGTGTVPAAGTGAAAAEGAAAGKGDGTGGDGDAAGKDGAGKDGGKPAADEVIPPLRVAEISASRDIPKDLDAQIKGVEDGIKALDKKLDDGEIEQREYNKELRKLQDQRQDLRDMKVELDTVARTNDANMRNAWKIAQDDFYRDNPEFKSPIMQAALDGALRELYRNPKLAGADYGYLLKRAGADVNAATGRGKPADPPAGDEKPALTPAQIAAAAAKKTPAAARAAQNAERADRDRKNVPQTLGGLPQAGQDRPGTDEFSHLDGLAGMELEEALSRMTSEQQAKYLSM